MNKLVFLVFAILLPQIAEAQKIQVESFIEKSLDLTASTHSRLDNNGIPCALIKVQLARKDAGFEGNVVGSVEYKISEYYVYMASGSKRMTVKLEGYLPLEINFADYGITHLESKRTYTLVITGILTKEPQEKRMRTGWIILDSYPQGASAYINGDFVGTTPLNNYKQPYGSYSYRLDKPNYHSVTGTIELNSNRFEKTEKLLPAFGTINVTSSVSGASVLLDGKATDMYTPCTLDEIPSGQHTITVQLDKYAPKQTSITVEDSKTTMVNAALDARFASIIVRSLNGASIYIDDVFQGTSSSTIELMEGYYDIEVRLDHHKTVSKQIQVVAGQPQMLELFPVPIYGSLDIMSTPHNASITIDGKPYGKTPFTVDQLLEGDHTVTLSLEGHSTETRVVTIGENKTESLTATLQRGREITITCPTAGSHIFIDETDMGTAPFNGIIQYGTHVVYAQSNGKKSNEYTISSHEGNGPLPSITLALFESKTFTVNDVQFTMIAVEGGTFKMGSTDKDPKLSYDTSKPVHKVTINNFFLGQTEVTQALWKAVMGDNPSYRKGDQLPVESVSWDDCIYFIYKLNQITGLNFRLPTEAEWEFAARGGTKSRNTKYSGANNIDDCAWHERNSIRETHTVATRMPNELGIFDMSGNVSEWCNDSFHYYSGLAQINPQYTHGDLRVNRGGSYNDSYYCYVFFRHCDIAHNSFSTLGLRLALDE